MAAKNCEAADRFAATLRAKLNADLIGRSYSDIARSLNDAGVMTVTGRKFYPQTVKNYLRRQTSTTPYSIDSSVPSDVDVRPHLSVVDRLTVLLELEPVPAAETVATVGVIVLRLM